MSQRVASTAVLAAAPIFPVCNPPIHAPLFERDSDDDSEDLIEPGPLAAVLISPVKAQAVKRGIANMSDLEVWDLPDSEIIGT